MFAAEYTPAERPVRRGRRAPVAVPAPVEQSGMARTLCKVMDLSLHGCRLLTFSAMARDESIWLTIPGLGVVAAIVVAGLALVIDFGHLTSVVPGLAISVALIAVQSVLSRLWLARFVYGPVEWAWRSVTWWRPAALVRRAS